jgi:hypothetical protein
MVGSRRHFEAGHQLPVHQFTTAVVQVVIVRVDRQHSCSPQADSVEHSLAAGGVWENGRKGQKGINMAKRFDRNSPLNRTSTLQHWAWNAKPVGAGLPAKAVVQSMEMRRMY